MSIKQPMILAILFCGLILGSVIGDSMTLNEFSVILLFISSLLLAISFSFSHLGEYNWKEKALVILFTTTASILAYGFIFFSGELYDYILNLLMERLNQN
ncbi:hypothetical protein IIU_06577 [Bacillus cereus VD133]|uniref:Uncharacterized protein n=1 Tax=Bacillus cereus VD133 TaxID=1053233 RepID=A0A9W5PK51_BACCE|nr:hypothetical protein [Bacillus cereus]EOO25004.1 hypothetical protein IIU_06577 [Bacillus cereus VD133]